jgi:hypothetical protein
MPSRFAIAAIFAFLAIHISSAQQVTSDVVVSNASLNDGYGGWSTCGVDGQVYRHPSGRLRSIMRVSRDGSTLLFTVPDDVWPGTFAPAGTGLNILGSHVSQTEGRTYEMYHFDSQANLVGSPSSAHDFFPRPNRGHVFGKNDRPRSSPGGFR